MIVFKTFWNIIKKYLGVVMLYTFILIIFGGLNMTTSDATLDFSNVKPDIFIINKDNSLISSNLVEYLTNNSNIVSLKEEENAFKDALFYRTVSYIVYIPENYGREVLNGKDIELEIKSTKDYEASLAELMLTRYLKMQHLYRDTTKDERALVDLINKNLEETITVNMTSKVDTSKTSRMALYYNFASYSIMAVIIYIICLVVSSFKNPVVNKRTIISSKNYKIFNRELLLSSLSYAFIVFLLYNLLAIIILKESMFSIRGLCYVINSFGFTLVSLTIALLVSSLIQNKNAVSGIVNVISLGSAFLCGAFVPASMLPTSVLNLAHVLPAYWYINSNDQLKNMEILDFFTLKPVLINFLVMLLFALLFIILNNWVTKKKRVIS